MSGSTVNLIRSAAPAVMPGPAVDQAYQLLESEFSAPHMGALAELPDRGHHASLLGRASAQLSELYTELTSYGWRLVPRPGADHQRAAQLLRSDVDTLADVRGARADQGDDVGPLRLEMLGPVSFAAGLALPGGEKVLADHGARRDLAESLAAGAAEHVAHVRRAVAPSSLSVVILEPDYARVRTAQVPTVSGYKTLRAVSRDETRSLLGAVVDALRAAGADEVLLDFGTAVTAEQAEDFFSRHQARVDGFGIAVPLLGTPDWERVAELAEGGALFSAGLLRAGEAAPTAAGPTGLPQVTDLSARLLQPWQRLGMPLNALGAATVTPFGALDRPLLGRVSQAQVMRVATRIRDTAEALTEHINEH